MCRYPSGWCNRMRSKRINIWQIKRMHLHQHLCHHPYTEVKFTRPYWLTRFGFPANPRTDRHELGSKGEKYCDMSKLHQQENRARPFLLERHPR
mmetsp:Transcript_67297/g.156233  ORF Transcript_67297/g.156233 Transcript_67297/m.156233 type:complete len:94 (+) Transcript_67297:129-410(+)